MHKKNPNRKKKRGGQTDRHTNTASKWTRQKRKKHAIYAIDWTLELCLWLLFFFGCDYKTHVLTSKCIKCILFLADVPYALSNSRRFNSNNSYFMLCTRTVWLIFIFHSNCLFVCSFIFSFVINGQLHTMCSYVPKYVQSSISICKFGRRNSDFFFFDRIHQ